MTDLSVFDIPFEGIEKNVMAWAAEALELRHGAAGDPEGPLAPVPRDMGPEVIDNMLFRARQRSDRVDELLSKVTMAKARAKRAQDAAAFQADVSRDQALKKNLENRRVEFTTREERSANAALDSLEERRTAHSAARLVSITTEAYDIVSQVHWSLNGIRKDLREQLASFQFESTLER